MMYIKINKNCFNFYYNIKRFKKLIITLFNFLLLFCKINIYTKIALIYIFFKGGYIF